MDKSGKQTSPLSGAADAGQPIGNPSAMERFLLQSHTKHTIKRSLSDKTNVILNIILYTEEVYLDCFTVILVAYLSAIATLKKRSQQS